MGQFETNVVLQIIEKPLFFVSFFPGIKRKSLEVFGNAFGNPLGHLGEPFGSFGDALGSLAGALGNLGDALGSLGNALGSLLERTYRKPRGKPAQNSRWLRASLG